MQWGHRTRLHMAATRETSGCRYAAARHRATALCVHDADVQCAIASGPCKKSKGFAAPLFLRRKPARWGKRPAATHSLALVFNVTRASTSDHHCASTAHYLGDAVALVGLSHRPCGARYCT